MARSGQRGAHPVPSRRIQRLRVGAELMRQNELVNAVHSCEEHTENCGVKGRVGVSAHGGPLLARMEAEGGWDIQSVLVRRLAGGYVHGIWRV